MASSIMSLNSSSIPLNTDSSSSSSFNIPSPGIRFEPEFYFAESIPSSALADIEESQSFLITSETPWDTICNYVRDNQVSVLDLKFRKMDDAQFATLCHHLKCNHSVQCLLLCHETINAAKAKELASVIRLSSSLNTLEMPHCRFEPGCFEILTGALAANHSMKKLNLANNLLGPSGLTEFAQVLEHNTTLIHVDLSGNKIGPDGTGPFSKALEKNKTVKFLNLKKNEFKVIGVEPIFGALKVNQALECLDLSDNGFTGVIADLIRDAVKKSPSLMKLYLNENHLTNTGAIALAEAIKENPRLKQLYLSQTYIEDEGAKKLIEALEHRSLLTLDISCNRISQKTYEEISEQRHTLATQVILELFQRYPPITLPPDRSV